MQAINPATEKVVREYPELSDTEVARRLDLAEEGFRRWRETPFSERSTKMYRAADALRRDAETLARLITEEMGKPIREAEAEIEKCAWVCDFYAEHAKRFLTGRRVETDASKSYVAYEPLGAVLAVMPWNFPFWQVFRFAAPAVMAGNVGVLKHASNVPGCALAVEQIFHKAGFPEGVMTTMLISSSRTTELIGPPAVRAVTITGSDKAGAAVAAEAGRHVKKTVLELGGSDPFIVLADANPVEAAKLAVRSRTINSGQSCIAAKRFIVEEPIAGAFEGALTDLLERLQVGDPMDPATDVGPLARKDLLDELDEQVTASLEAGARLRTGGDRLDRQGYFYQPTLLSSVEPGMPVFDEETFGPVAAVIRARDRDHAVELANQTRYGLAACIVSGNTRQAEELAGRIQAGSVFINGMVKSDPRLPFGGIKHSGYGRELSEEGIREFVNVKTVWVK